MDGKIVYTCISCFYCSPESSCIQELASTVLVSHCQLSFATWFRRKVDTLILCLSCPFLPDSPFRISLSFPSFIFYEAPLTKATITGQDHLIHSLRRAVSVFGITKDCPTFFSFILTLLI